MGQRIVAVDDSDSFGAVLASGMFGKELGKGAELYDRAISRIPIVSPVADDAV